MIESLYDSRTGVITEFPHTMIGELRISDSNGNSIVANFICTEDEIIKYDDEHIYARRPSNPATVYEYDVSGYCGKSYHASEFGLLY